MSNAGTQAGSPPTTASTDLWKFFEEKGAQQKESMFKLVTWIIGFTGVILGYAVSQGFEKGLEKLAHPRMVFVLGLAGFFVTLSTFWIVRDHGQHINRTYARADAARHGESAPQKIWDAGKAAEDDPLPPICRQLLFVVRVFGASFLACAIVGLLGMLGLYPVVTANSCLASILSAQALL
jgi:hypothetical protein